MTQGFTKFVSYDETKNSFHIASIRTLRLKRTMKKIKIKKLKL